MLIQSFLQFVSIEDRNLLNNMMTSFDMKTVDDLLDILSLYKCKSKPTAENIRLLIVDLSHLIMIQQPKYISAAFVEVFNQLKKPLFKDVDSIECVYKEKTPSCRKLVKLLQFQENITEKQHEVKSFLIKYLKSLTIDNLKRFLVFVSGSDNLPDGLDVVLVEQIYRAPCARVCVNQLELSDNYTCYNELAEEFTNVLNSADSFSFSFV